MCIATITSKGQLTVPVDVRKDLQLNSGTKIKFQKQGNGYFICVEDGVPPTFTPFIDTSTYRFNREEAYER